MRLIALCLTLVATSASAQEGMRESDQRLSKTQLAELLTGQVLEFYSNSFATYYPDGRYEYQYEPGGERVPGTYELMDDSTVCTVFQNQFERCDFLVLAGDRLVMIIENGERYPVRDTLAIE